MSNNNTISSQLQSGLKAVLKNCDGKLRLSDLPERWKATHGTRLQLAVYGVPNLSVLIDRCRTVCRYIRTLGCNGDLPRVITSVKHGSACRLQRINGVEVVTLVYNQHVVSSFVANIQQELHRSKRHIASGLVISQICQQLGVTEYKELGLGTPQQLPVLRRLSELEGRLVTYITSYIATRLQPDIVPVSIVTYVTSDIATTL